MTYWCTHKITFNGLSLYGLTTVWSPHFSQMSNKILCKNIYKTNHNFQNTCAFQRDKQFTYCSTSSRLRMVKNQIHICVM